MRNASFPGLEGSSAQHEPSPKRGLRDEAAHCREQARCFAGRPEEALLIQLAGAFEKLRSARNGRRQQRN
jgi:hypothetical protein